MSIINEAKNNLFLFLTAGVGYICRSIRTAPQAYYILVNNNNVMVLQKRFCREAKFLIANSEIDVITSF